MLLISCVRIGMNSNLLLPILSNIMRVRDFIRHGNFFWDLLFTGTFQLNTIESNSILTIVSPCNIALARIDTIIKGIVHAEVFRHLFRSFSMSKRGGN